MEQLLVRQEEELDKLAKKQNDELEALEESFGVEEDGFVKVFHERRERLRRRWSILEEVKRKNMENEKKVKFAPLAPVTWPDLEPKQDEGLEAVME
jgi:hypothetical protein